MREDFYRIHGVSLRLTTGSSTIASVVQRHLRHFEGGGRPSDIDICLTGVHKRADIPVRISPAAQCLISHDGSFTDKLHPLEWRFAVYRDGARKLIDFHEQGLLCIEDQQGQAEGYLIQPDAMEPYSRLIFFHFALTELLRRKGLYIIYASALERDGRGVLIPGFSGQGKTTSCIALLRAGYRCLSDDHPFVRENQNGLELLPFPVKIDVTEETIEFFPELGNAK